MSVLSFEGLKKRYGGRLVLDAGRGALESGKCQVLAGPNGSGKTTLMRIIALLEEPDSGTVELDGAPVLGLGGDPLVRARRRICYVSQNPYLFAGSVMGNVLYGLKARGIGSGEARKAAALELESLGMSGFAHARASGLSAGERQKAALARAFAAKPDFLLLDEPTAFVDRESVPLIEKRIESLRAESGACCLVATHDAGLARRIAPDSAMFLDSGRLLEGSRENFFRGAASASGSGIVFTAAPGVVLSSAAPAGFEGTCSASISPDEIILSRTPVSSSARNMLEGSVEKIEKAGTRVFVTLDAGIPLVASISVESLASLDLSPGKGVFALFKASAVRIHAEFPHPKS